MSMSDAMKKKWEAKHPKGDTHSLDVYAGDGEHAWKLHHGAWGSMDVARLIAAAPELLAALKYIAEWKPEGWSAERARDLARAAIAKAEGK